MLKTVRSLKKKIPGLGSWLIFVYFTMDNIPELKLQGLQISTWNLGIGVGVKITLDTTLDPV